MNEKIDAVKDRIDYLTTRIRSGKAGLKKANQRIQHFLKVAQDAVSDWKKAEKNNNREAMAKAKARAHRAHKKLAFWDEVRDDIKLGQKNAIKRRAYQRKKLALLQKLQSGTASGAGFTTIDGKQVPNWMVEGILEMRRRGLWHGYIVSGYRTPEYSRQLCQQICGRDSCSGTCAGVSSNHTCPPTFSGIRYEGAVDVSDYYNFGAGCRILGLNLRNDLPIDRVHFSESGH